MDAIDRGLVTPMGMIFRSGRMDTPALASGGSLAYRARLRPVPCVPPCLLSSRMTFGNWITVAGSFTPVV